MNNFIKQTIIDILCGSRDVSILRDKMLISESFEQSVFETIDEVLCNREYKEEYDKYLTGPSENESDFFETVIMISGLRCLNGIHDNRKENFEKEFFNVYSSKKGIQKRLINWFKKTIYCVLFEDGEKMLNMINGGIDLYECICRLSLDIEKEEQFIKYIKVYEKNNYDVSNILFNLTYEYFDLICFYEFPTCVVDVFEYKYSLFLDEYCKTKNNDT